MTRIDGGNSALRSPGVVDRVRLVWLVLATGAGLAVLGGAHAEDTVKLSELSFEQLTSMEVSGVSKSVERLLDAPAAVTVITSDEIRAYGFRTLAEVLNTVPGFRTYSDRAYSYVAVQGFGPIEDYNSRVLLLIDGFPANDDFFQQALVGSEGLFDLDLVDRIEVVRGPSSSVYGNSAFFGVINVIMKTPSQVLSGATVWAGSGNERGLSGTLSAAAGEDTRYFLRATESATQGLDVVYPPQPGIPLGARVSGEDGYDDTRAFAKIVSGNLRLNLAFSERRQQAGYGLYGDLFDQPMSFVRDGETFGDLRYEGAVDDATDYALRASLAEYRYDSDIVDPNPLNGAPLPGFFPARGDWVDTEATLTRRFSSTDRLIVGAELRRDWRIDATESNAIEGNFLQIRTDENRYGVYAQSDIDWSEHWSTSLGVRDDYDDDATHLNPRVALIWKPTSDQAVKLMYGSAFREPSPFEQFFAQPPYIIGNPELQDERVRTFDLAYENQLTETSRFSVTAFRYRAIDLITQEVVNPAISATQYQNAEAAQARGIDVSVEQHVHSSFTARLSASYVYAFDAAGNWEQNSPKWTGRLGAEQQLIGAWKLAGEALFASQREAIDNAPLPAYTVANFTVANQPRPGKFDFSLRLLNAFNRIYAEPVAGWQGDRVNQLGRTWLISAGYSL